MEGQINSPNFSFVLAFVMIMLIMDKPQKQATLTKLFKNPKILFRFRFRNSTERKSKIMDFYFYLLVIVSVRMVGMRGSCRGLL